MKIEGKTAIVIGGARGIGHAFCVALLDKGAKLCMGDLNEKDGQEVVADFNKKYGENTAVFKRCDVRKEADVEDIFQTTKTHFGAIDIVVDNVGIMHEFKWELALELNVGGIIRCTNAALRHMGKDKGGNGGVVVNMASLSGLAIDAECPVYTATKSAVIAYTRAWAKEPHCDIHGIRFNCICSGLMNTPSLDEMLKDGSEERIYFQNEAKELLKGLKRLELSRVAEGLVVLVEDDTKNGQALRVTHQNGIDYATFEEQPFN